MKRILVLFMFPFLLFGIACGKRGPSLPPIVIAPDTCSDLTVSQRGDSLVTAFSLPEKNTDGSVLIEIPSAEILVYVSEESIGEPRLEEFLKRAQRQIVSQDELEKRTIGKKVFLDRKLSELFSGEFGGMRYTVAVRLMNRKKRLSPLSKVSSVTIVKPIEPPMHLDVRSEEEGIRLSWQPSPSEQDQSCGTFYNVYRREVSQDEAVQTDASQLVTADAMRYQSILLNQRPIPEASYLDESSLFGKAYLYSVRAVCGESIQLRESDDSNIVSHSHRDTFAPAPPSGLAAVSEEAVIRLFWFPNAEKDCSGYNVYRKSEDDDAFSLIASLPAYRTSFTDENVTFRMQYRYYITAIDTASYPNESDPSEVVRETSMRSEVEGRGKEQ